MSLEGKVALVIGCGRKLGIGRACALRLARDGADVAVADVAMRVKSPVPGDSNAEYGIDMLAEEINEMGRRSVAVVCDLTSEESVEKAIQTVVDQLGKLDILFNNASAGWLNIRKPVVDLDVNDWDRTFAINSTGTMLACKYGARQMIKQGHGGRIINTSSVSGRNGGAGVSAYSSSKFAIVGLTQSLAREVGQYGISVNALCPGAIETWRPDPNEEEKARSEGLTWEEVYTRDFVGRGNERGYLGRIGTPEDVAGVVAFLSTDDAVYVSGQAIHIDAGVVTF